MVAYPGFFIEVNSSNQMMLGVYDQTYCRNMEFDYSDLNCPVTPSTTAYSMTKPYAIREGGGTHIPNLGDVIHNLRNNSNSQRGETYEFYLFSRGCVQWVNGLTLDIAYFHQWANGGMPSVNIQVDGKILRGKGGNAGISNAATQSQQLPNIKSDRDLYTAAPYENQKTVEDGGFGGNRFFKGVFYLTKSKTYAVTSGTVTGYTYAIGFDASRANLTYTDGGEVRMACIVTTYLLQAF